MSVNYKIYVIETLAYGVFSLFAFTGLIYFLFIKDYFLVFLSIIALLVSLDNFFCSSRTKKCGFSVRKHFIIPPFLKRSAKGKPQAF